MVKKAVLFLILFLMPLALMAQDYSFQATVDSNTTEVATPVNLALTFYGAQDVPAPKLPDIDGVSARYYGPSSRVSFVNGKGSSSIAHNYVLMPTKTGSFEIPAVTIEYKGVQYTTTPITITVTAQTTLAQNAGSAAQGNFSDLRNRIFLTIDSQKDEVYVGEEFLIKIKLYNNNLNLGNTVKAMGFLPDIFKVESITKGRTYNAVSNGIDFQIHEFDARVKAKTAQTAEVAAHMELPLLVQNRRRDDDMGSLFGGSFLQSIFDNYQEYPLSLDSQTKKITVKELPEEGKPADFNGLIGDYKINIEASPTQVKVGDPVTLRVHVRGDGSLKDVPFPITDYKDDFKSYDPAVKSSEEGKDFEQVIVPLKSTVTKIPPLRLGVFDTVSGTYRTIESGSLPLTVIPADSASVAKSFDGDKPKVEVQSPAVLGEDIVFIKNNPGRFVPVGRFLCQDIFYYLFLLFGAVLVAAIGLLNAHQTRMKNDAHYARGLLAPAVARKGIKAAQKALKQDTPQAFYEQVFKTLQDYLGGRFHTQARSITAEFVDERLKAMSVQEDILVKLRDLFRECDMARFADGQFTVEVMERSLESLRAIVDYLERRK